MPAGPMRKRCAFKRQDETTNGKGGFTIAWTTVATVWGQLKPQRGTERLEGARLEANLLAVLKVRSSATMRAITESYKVTIDSVDYQIRSISNPDQRDRSIEFLVERGGVAQ